MDERNAIINTPGTIGADIETVTGLVRELDADIEASKSSALFKGAWRGFVEEWTKFVKDTGYWGRWWYATKEHVDEYRRRVHDWRAMFVAEGGKSAAPEDHPPTAPNTKWTGVAALVLGATLVGGAFIVGALRRQ